MTCNFITFAIVRPTATNGSASAEFKGYQVEYTRPSGPGIPICAGTLMCPSSADTETASIDRSSGEMITGGKKPTKINATPPTSDNSGRVGARRDSDGLMLIW